MMWQKHSEKQSLAVGTKQSKQVERTVRAAQSLFFCLMPTTSALVLFKWMFHKLKCV